MGQKTFVVFDATGKSNTTTPDAPLEVLLGVEVALGPQMPVLEPGHESRPQHPPPGTKTQVESAQPHQSTRTKVVMLLLRLPTHWRRVHA